MNEAVPQIAAYLALLSTLILAIKSALEAKNGSVSVKHKGTEVEVDTLSTINSFLQTDYNRVRGELQQITAAQADLSALIKKLEKRDEAFQQRESILLSIISATGTTMPKLPKVPAL